MHYNGTENWHELLTTSSATVHTSIEQGTFYVRNAVRAPLGDCATSPAVEMTSRLLIYDVERPRPSLREDEQRNKSAERFFNTKTTSTKMIVIHGPFPKYNNAGCYGSLNYEHATPKVNIEKGLMQRDIHI